MTMRHTLVFTACLTTSTKSPHLVRQLEIKIAKMFDAAHAKLENPVDAYLLTMQTVLDWQRLPPWET